MDAPARPADFLWGVATSAQQIEGAAGEDGRGESIWDRFASVPGRIADGSDPAVACDHYHRWREDLDLLRRLGVGAYRFSIAWPRVLPDGRGKINPAGLDFYDALVDALLAAGIRPFATLYHWDLPQALQERGGWNTRDTAAAFADYAAVVGRRLGDRVLHWATHNEPWCVATLGHEAGEHAPGHRDPAEALRVGHHLLVSHGWAAQVLRQSAPGAAVGIVLIFSPAYPASDDDADREAARRFDGAFNRWYLEPLLRGRYPEDAVADRVRRGHLPGPELPFVRRGDLQAIASPLDFLGVNYYSRVVVRAGEGGEPVAVPVAPVEERTDMGWEVFPDGLRDLLLRLHREYRPPVLYVTENGMSHTVAPDAAGRVADARRIDYLRAHVAAMREAMAAGVPLGGYFVWSLLDNWEWARGYGQRFGLYHVDYATQRRLPKDSAAWYRDLVAAGPEADAAGPSNPRRVP
jgi:beta-glucosidase